MSDAFEFQTADLSDEFTDHTLVVEPMFSDFGTRPCFSGPIATLKVFEDNSLVRETLSEAGEGRVLVVDGGGSMRCALVGDRLAELARDQGWAGIVVYGCIRDSMVIDGIDIGVKAIGTHPRKSIKRGVGERGIEVTFGGVTFTPGHFLYADGDGVLVSPKALG
ncbi:uncharacterized protein METZ01_LOCUS401185 [marine metagenome]|jgi:regulator of ribonuclease activity A|uniref:Oxaloacetate decarboxylase n=1 Tax=marine metagenome TaxID=408172 RepID=A0A382VQZ7_9ZZZZ